MLSPTCFKPQILGWQNCPKQIARRHREPRIEKTRLARDADLGMFAKREPAQLLAANPAGFEKGNGGKVPRVHRERQRALREGVRQARYLNLVSNGDVNSKNPGVKFG